VTTDNYDSPSLLRSPKITITTAHVKSSESLLAVAFVAASNGGRSFSSGFPNSQLPASRFSQLQLSTNSTKTPIHSSKLLLALASAVILWSNTLGTRDDLLVSQFWDFRFRLLRLAGSRWRYSTPPPHGTSLSGSTTPVFKRCLPNRCLANGLSSLLSQKRMLASRCVAMEYSAFWFMSQYILFQLLLLCVLQYLYTIYTYIYKERDN
jgi:hypothetical protein